MYWLWEAWRVQGTCITYSSHMSGLNSHSTTRNVGFPISGKRHNSKRVSLSLARKTSEGFLHEEIQTHRTGPNTGFPIGNSLKISWRFPISFPAGKVWVKISQLETHWRFPQFSLGFPQKEIQHFWWRRWNGCGGESSICGQYLENALSLPLRLARYHSPGLLPGQW